MEAMAYRDGRLAEINLNEDLFLKRLMEAEDWPTYFQRAGFTSVDSFSGERVSNPIISHEVWRSSSKYLVILWDACEAYALVRLESHIEFMHFCRDYLPPLVELDSYSVALAKK